ncbi:hypothetical protein FRC06_011696 [Ceratobasidium sp. 370]|nr:hypothetical protein FRC06_011696 [Ceratobasidium sp. 370]
MDPAWYSTQGASAHPDYGGNNQQLVADDPNAVQDYLRALYQNPSHQILAPTNNPAFFDKARQGILEAKHKTEQMLLALRQQEEMTRLLNTKVVLSEAYGVRVKWCT